MEYKLITERAHLYAPNIHVCFAVEFCTVFSIDALREAVKKVLQKHPILRSAVRFDENGNAFYHIEEEVEPEFSVTNMTGEKSWISVVAREQEKPFVLSRAPLLRFTCLKNESRMQMVMCLHHILADGLSCVIILQDITSFLQNPDRAAEVRPVDLLEDSSLYKEEKLALPAKLLVNSLNRQWRKAPRIFTEKEYCEMRRSYWRQRSHTIDAAELSSEKVRELAAKCRENGVTVNSFLIAALLECSQKIDRENKKAGLAVSIRPDETHVGNFASGISIKYVYHTGKSVWENASAVQKIVTNKLNNNKRKYFFLTFMKALDMRLIDSMYFRLFGNFSNKTTDKLRKILGYLEKPVGLGLTNLGKTGLSEKQGIKSVYFIPPLIANTDKIAGVITADSGLRVVYQYSDQANTEENKRLFEAWICSLRNL